MEKENIQKYKNKAKASFKTKKNLFVFYLAINKELKISDLSFDEFKITDNLVKLYTSEYWQQELDYTINGLKISEIEKRINIIENENIELFTQLEKEYIASFSNIFPESDFDKLLLINECHYCKITVDEIEQLGNRKLLFKKNLRGWNLEIDRINSNYEYFPENCVMSCYWCNNAKTDEFTEAEFLKIGVEIKKIWKDRLNDFR